MGAIGGVIIVKMIKQLRDKHIRVIDLENVGATTTLRQIKSVDDLSMVGKEYLQRAILEKERRSVSTVRTRQK